MSSQTAIVTGAARGIGRTIALRLAKDGFDVCVSDLSSSSDLLETVAQEIRGLGRKALTVSCDVTKLSDIENAIAKTVEALGPLDVFVANAGIAFLKPLILSKEEEIQKIHETNLYSVIYSNIAAGKQFIKQGNGGKIINAASIAGFKPLPLTALYSSTKAAIRSVTQSFASEYGPHGITVNAYAPGHIHTPMWETIDADVSKALGTKPGFAAQAFAKQMPPALGRVGTPEDVAKVVSFLAGPDSDFVTGQTIIVDGGSSVGGGNMKLGSKKPSAKL